MLLRNVEPGDVDAYVRMRCDPVMMADLGGPLPRDGIEAHVHAISAAAAADTAWCRMIVPDPARPDVVAGSVMLWRHEDDDLPEGISNGPSNGICRSVGFRLVGQEDVEFAGRTLHTNHWVIDT